jgi:hypothetical protein
MATRVDIEEIQTTKSEKFLALVLGVFVLIGGIWTYEKIDDYVREAVALDRVEETEEERAAFERLDAAVARVEAAQARRSAARDELELAREAYRTALEAGEPADALERDYRSAQAEFEAAEVELQEAQADRRAAQPDANAAQRALEERSLDREDRRALYAFLFRGLFVAALLAFGYWLLARLRGRGSRYLPVSFALLGAATILAFVLAADYVTDYVDPLDLGPLVLALVGIAATLAAFWWLQRYLARRIPFRRVRKGECPFCGFPVTGTRRCEGCGREVVASCATCGASRRVGTLHCGACGRA